MGNKAREFIKSEKASLLRSRALKCFTFLFPSVRLPRRLVKAVIWRARKEEREPRAPMCLPFSFIRLPHRLLTVNDSC